VPGAPVAASDDWADAVLLDDGSRYGVDGDEAEDTLPPQYAAIASAWLE
jgi:hypothetical protein